MSFASSTQPQVASLTNRDTELASLGSYYVASTPTPGTGVISNNPTSLVATTPYLVLYNGGALDVHLHYLRLLNTVASTGAAQRNFTHFIDQGNRYASGGTGLTIKNTNALSASASNATATVGVVTATAASGNQKQIGNTWPRGGGLIDIVGDIYEWDFGGRASSTGSNVATVAHFVHQMPPIVLPPNTSYVLNIWSATFTTGITFEVSMGFSER